MKRNLARPGLSYVDANAGRLVTYERDVLDIKGRIESTWPELSCVFDTVDEVWCIIEHCKDGVDRLVFDTPSLNEGIIERITRADGTKNDLEDMIEAMDRYNDEVDQKRLSQYDDEIGEAHERLIHALRKDGFITSGPVYMGDEIGNRKGRVKRKADYR